MTALETASLRCYRNRQATSAQQAQVNATRAAAMERLLSLSISGMFTNAEPDVGQEGSATATELTSESTKLS